MKITILTLFPELFETFKNHSIIKNAINKKKLELKIVNFRDYSKDKHKKVDGKQIGGGGGMVLALQPIVDCLKENKTSNSCVCLMTPQGKLWNQEKAKAFSKKDDIILICGHYEGFDERLNDYVDESISIGDYILTGGETASMVIVESVIRLVNGVITKTSLDTETLDDGLLDYPAYAKPIEFEGKKVPELLLSGKHDKIKDWREEQRIKNTKLNRPDLMRKIKYLKDFNFYFKMSDDMYTYFHDETYINEKIRKWYYSMEKTINDQLKKWKLFPVKVFNSGWVSVTMEVKDKKNKSYVFKYHCPFCEPNEMDNIYQIYALKECNGIGLPKLYQEDMKNNCYVMEKLDGHNLCTKDGWNGYIDKIKVFYECCKKIHNVKIKDKIYLKDGVNNLYQWLHESKIKSDKFDKLTIDAFKKTLTIIKKAIKNGDYSILHGDIHAGNVIENSKDIRLIDPHGFIGPKEMDYSDFIDASMWDVSNYDNFKKTFGKQFDEILQLTQCDKTLLISCFVTKWIAYVYYLKFMNKNSIKEFTMCDFIIKYYNEINFI